MALAGSLGDGGMGRIATTKRQDGSSRSKSANLTAIAGSNISVPCLELTTYDLASCRPSFCCSLL